LDFPFQLFGTPLFLPWLWQSHFLPILKYHFLV
jgi:hypothetical protein